MRKRGEGKAVKSVAWIRYDRMQENPLGGSKESWNHRPGCRYSVFSHLHSHHLNNDSHQSVVNGVMRLVCSLHYPPFMVMYISLYPGL